MKKNIDWGEVFLAVFIFIVAGIPTICMIIFLIFPSTRDAESETVAPVNEIVASRSSEPSPPPSLDPDYDADDADRDFQQAANAAMQAVEDGEYDGPWEDLVDGYLANNADYQHFIHTSPTPSPSKVPTSAVIPPPPPTVDSNSGEQFAMIYDGAVLEYVTISADGLQDIPSWLIVDACVDNGVEIFDICAPVEGYFETVDVPIYNPSQFTIRFSFDCDSGAFDGELIDYHMPEYLYAEFVLDGSTPDGRLYGCVDGTITVYYTGYDGDDYMEEYYFCPDITVQLQ